MNEGGSLTTPASRQDSSGSLPSGSEWDKLLTLMQRGLVIPVIGPEIMLVEENQQKKPLYDLWGMELAQRRRMASLPSANSVPLLYQVANHIIASDRELVAGDLEYEIDEVIRQQPWPLPESLRLLAEISDFPLYLTTTIDHLMVRALEETGRGKPLQIAFKLGGDKTRNDLPGWFSIDKKASMQPLVFHLFGATCVDPGGFAATEDDLIEFSWSLIDREYSPERLYDFLREKTILLLGCDFPDWLERFFVRSLAGKRGSTRTRIHYVSTHGHGNLLDFLRRRRARVWTSLTPVDFIRELHQRWSAQQGESAGQQESLSGIKPGSVFISYAREDQAAAIAIRDQLEAAGIDTWMDESGLEPGAEFQYVIQDNIARAGFFLAVISRALDLDSTDRPGRFVFREWKWAEDINHERRKCDSFLQPVVVDDTLPGAPYIDPPFRDLHWSSLQGGRLPPEFITFLTKGMRRFRSSREMER